MRSRTGIALFAATLLLAASLPRPLGAGPADPSSESEGKSSATAWLTLDPQEREAVERHATEYGSFMFRAKTELSFVREAVKMAREAGFRPLEEDSKLTAGARFFDVNRDRAMALVVIGQQDLRQGFQVVGAHIDSFRLELKPRVLYEVQGFALFQTNYHGGLKTYQWTNIPLALMGRIDKKDGSTVWISVGNAPDELVFVIPDLFPHVDR